MLPLSRLSALLALAWAASPALSQTLTLEDALNKALRGDPTYLASEKTLEAGREARPQGVAGILPTISGSATRYQRDYTGGTYAGTTLTPKTFAVSLSQPIFNLSLLRKAQQGTQKVASAEATFTKARQDTFIRVAAAYFDVLSAQDDLSSAQAEKKAIAEQLEQAKRSFEVGTATITDQQEAQARFDLILANEIKAQNTLDVNRHALSLIVRETISGPLKSIQKSIPIPRPEPLDPLAWVDQARSSNPSVRKAEADLETARLQVGAQFAGHLPSLNLVANRTVARDASTTAAAADYEYNYVGVELSIPIFAGGLVTSQVREAAALRSKAELDLEAARLSAEQEARSAYLNVLAGLAQVSAYEAAEKSSQLALDSNKLGYEVGVRINIDILNSQQQLFTAKRNLSKARYDVLLASLKLKAAVGALSLADVQAVSQLMAKASD